ncbi:MULTISPECIES: metallophosphoesterase family protein [Thermomonosporaceae]|uniref:metallophosphoesterase family protein n=1 Tax=Thermomonosporaceae TaxID=2012 RepID=UPI00255B13E7|nr:MULTISPECIES: metallophosphoesterase [Thermomonosporaceae]MDL4773098.1 metallophosphoesterase [Actinomadura xylanilytica]
MPRIAKAALARVRPPGGPRTRRAGRILAVAATGLAGGYLGLLLGGHVETAVGPTDVSLALRPSWTGGTTVDIPPLGALHLDTHDGPLALQAGVTELRPGEAGKLIESDAQLARVTDQITDQLRHGVTIMLLRAAGLGLLLAFLAALVAFRSWRRALLGTGSALAGLVVVALITWLTFNPQSVGEPRYTGLLANAPQVVGDARGLVARFSAYRAQLARLVGNVSKLYAATSSLPTYEPDPSTLRVLNVSDIHLNPTAWNVIRSVSAQFQINLIIDAGDLMDHGSKPEDKFADEIGKLKVPYVYVRGNHDSKGTQKAVARQKNAVVLDDDTRKVEGLTVYGVGDPRYTPDKSTRDDSVGTGQLHAAGAQLAHKLRASGTTPDIVVAHDPSEGDAFSGATPLVLSGHAHQRSTRLLPTGTRLFVQGSTGGAGLRGLEHEQPTPIELSVLYLSRSTHRLQGWDDLRLGGLGLTSAQIERHLEPAPDRPITPPTAPVPPSPSSPFPSLPQSQWPTTSASPSRSPERP